MYQPYSPKAPWQGVAPSDAASGNRYHLTNPSRPTKKSSGHLPSSSAAMRSTVLLTRPSSTSRAFGPLNSSGESTVSASRYSGRPVSWRPDHGTSRRTCFALCLEARPQRLGTRLRAGLCKHTVGSGNHTMHVGYHSAARSIERDDVTLE